MTPSLPRFAEVARIRPVALVQPDTSIGPGECGAQVPYVAATGPEPTLERDGLRLRAVRRGARVALEVERDGDTNRHSSVRSGRAGEVDDLAVSVTGPEVVAWSRRSGVWTARARARLGPRRWWAGLRAGDGVEDAGRFGQLGLRDPRVVSHPDGTPYREAPGAPYLLTATSAGPGGFRTGHTSVWAMDADALTLSHRADLFFSHGTDGTGGPAGPVLGHHATHLVRDGGAWLVATSTWGSFDARRRPGVAVRLGRSLADLTRGAHTVRTEPLALPVGGLDPAGVWDPHLVHDGERWLVAFVAARRFFSFFPAVAAGPDLDDLAPLGAVVDRTSCEGPTLVELPEGWRLLASDGRDEPASRRASYPCFDLTMRQLGRLDAAYPTNLPWPTLLPHDGGWLMVGFDGTPYGGRLASYGTHGDLVVQRGR